MSLIGLRIIGVSKYLHSVIWNNGNRSFSVFNHIITPTTCCAGSPTQGSLQSKSQTLLATSSTLKVPAAGMKQMGKLRRRCRYCFFIMIDERLHVWCDVHPRHKQMQMIPKPVSVIITTHATQGKLRPW